MLQSPVIAFLVHLYALFIAFWTLALTGTARRPLYVTCQILLGAPHPPTIVLSAIFQYGEFPERYLPEWRPLRQETIPPSSP